MIRGKNFRKKIRDVKEKLMVKGLPVFRSEG